MQKLAEMARPYSEFSFVVSLNPDEDNMGLKCRQNLAKGNVVVVPGFKPMPTTPPSLNVPYVRDVMDLDVEVTSYDVHGNNAHETFSVPRANFFVYRCWAPETRLF